MSRYLLILMMLMCNLPFAQAATEAPRDPLKSFFHESWNDFQEELQIARDENKIGIMFFFEDKDCPWCHRMKSTVLNQPKVQEYFRQHFRLIAVDIEGDIEVTDFSGKTTTQKSFALESNRVRATPLLAFYNLEGKRISKFTGATNDAEEFLLLGEYIVSEAYKKSRFSKYKRERRKQEKQTNQ